MLCFRAKNANIEDGFHKLTSYEPDKEMMTYVLLHEYNGLVALIGLWISF